MGKGEVLVGKSRWGRHRGEGKGGVAMGKSRWVMHSWEGESPAFPSTTSPLCLPLSSLPHRAFPAVPSHRAFPITPSGLESCRSSQWGRGKLRWGGQGGEGGSLRGRGESQWGRHGGGKREVEVVKARRGKGEVAVGKGEFLQGSCGGEGTRGEGGSRSGEGMVGKGEVMEGKSWWGRGKSW